MRPKNAISYQYQFSISWPLRDPIFQPTPALGMPGGERYYFLLLHLLGHAD
jgi:hypothetical protein